MENRTRRHLCILVGQMEVPQSVISCRSEETLQLSRRCYDAVTGRGAADVFGRVERGCMAVEVVIAPSHVTVKHGDQLINSIRLQELRLLMAMRSPGNHVVAAGYCQHAQTSVALVFEFADVELANIFIKDYQGCSDSMNREVERERRRKKRRRGERKGEREKQRGGEREGGGRREGEKEEWRERYTGREGEKDKGRDAGREDIQPKSPPRRTSVELSKHPSLSGVCAAPANSQEKLRETAISKPPIPPRTRMYCQEKPAVPSRNSVVGGTYKPTLPRRDSGVEQISPIAATAKPPLPQRISDTTSKIPPPLPRRGAKVAEICEAVASSRDTDSKIPPPLPRRATEAPENCDAAGSSKSHSPRFHMLNPFSKKERKGEESPEGQNQGKKGLFLRKNIKYENVEFQVEKKIETVTPSPIDDKEFADYEFPDSDDDSYGNFYGSFDRSVEDSERIFCHETVPHAEEKDKQTSSQADRINYFLTHEYNYLTSLSYIKAARTLSPELQPLLRGVDTLEELHHDLYRELYSSCQSYSSIAQALLSRREQLESYKYHMMNGPLIYAALAKVPETKLKDHPNLKDSLRISWKRLHFYFMSLEEFLASAPEGDKGVMQEAVAMLRELHALGDSAILIDGVKGTPFDLHIKGPLLLHGSFKIKGPEMQKKDYRALLFAEMLVITLPEGWTSRYQCSLRIDQLIPISQKSDSVSSFTVQVSDGGGKGKLYVFTARDEKTKEKWFNEITKLAAKIADEVKREFEKRYGMKPQA
ncbi:hypothetical protein C7M84_017640 [Penaeus vannamei]|uniref:PH domain-containing protein n=1 Tax=Penaeus vannamei TaxID=6689 RepID=A0A3R7MKX2_PENVA|nr:hypothetical protein C7M84_017640 [Penaeus vannamei]